MLLHQAIAAFLVFDELIFDLVAAVHSLRDMAIELGSSDQWVTELHRVESVPINRRWIERHG